MKLVKVLWKDAGTKNLTLSLDELKEEGLIDVISIGYLVDENKERIIVCGFIFSELTTGDMNMLNSIKDTATGFRDAHIIPKNQIVKIIELKEKLR